jgi:hypothetical protein
MKELPYFKFCPIEYINADVSFLSLEHQGLFIQICALYWTRDCKPMDVDMLYQRFSNATPLLDDLIKRNILKRKKNEVNILFLLNQFIELSGQHERRKMAGRLGGLTKADNSRAVAEPVNGFSNKDKDKDKDKDKIKEKEILKKKILSLLYELSVESEYCELILKWLEYKKERREKYKTDMTLKIFIKNLVKYSCANLEVAEQIVERSIGNNWAGIFEPNNSIKKPIEKTNQTRKEFG